jgi:hypothetical protein
VGLLLKRDIGETPAPTKEPDDIHDPINISLLVSSICAPFWSFQSVQDGAVVLVVWTEMLHPKLTSLASFRPRDAKGGELRPYLGLRRSWQPKGRTIISMSDLNSKGNCRKYLPQSIFCLNTVDPRRNTAARFGLLHAIYCLDHGHA